MMVQMFTLSQRKDIREVQLNIGLIRDNSGKAFTIEEFVENNVDQNILVDSLKQKARAFLIFR